MELTKKQTETLSKLETQLEEVLWNSVYYENPNPEVVSLFNSGIELNFQVKLLPYEGLNHPEGDHKPLNN